MTSRRVVVVAPSLAVRPLGGGDKRSLRLVQGLARHFDVHVVVVGATDASDAELAEAAGAQSLKTFPRLQSAAAKRAFALRHGWPLLAARSWVPAAADLVAQLCSDGATPVLLHLRTGVYRPDGAAAVVAVENVESDLARADRPRDAIRRAERRWEIVTTARLERQLAADPLVQLVAVSSADAAGLGPGCHVVPNGADLPTVPSPLPAAGTRLFVGSLDYPPNSDAVTWWAREIAGHLPDDLRRLTVVGRGGAAALADLAGHPDLDIVGEVADVTPYLSAAGVVVVPLRAGSGTRLKVLEAMAWGRPVVATSKGAEGIDGIVDGQNVVIADEAEAIAAAIRQLSDDPETAKRIAEAGRVLAADYAWPALAERFADIVRSAQ